MVKPVAFIFSEPSHGSLPYMCISSDSLLELIQQSGFKIIAQILPFSPSSTPSLPSWMHINSKTLIIIWKIGRDSSLFLLVGLGSVSKRTQHGFWAVCSEEEDESKKGMNGDLMGSEQIGAVISVLGHEG